MIESLSQVSVNKAGFTCEITHFTSSLVQATWVLARSRPVFVEFFCNRSSSLRWQGSSFFVQVCWYLAGDSGVKPL